MGELVARQSRRAKDISPAFPSNTAVSCTGIHVIFTVAGVLTLAANAGSLGAQQTESASQLIRETIYNELLDHNNHGYWRYWVARQVENDTRVEQQVETADGPITRLVQTNGRPVDEQTRDQERARLEELVKSPHQLANHRKDYADDEKRVAAIMELLPDAYVFEYAGEENGCHRLHFRPSPTYVPHSVEARVVHSMSGDVWIDARMKRLSRLEGHLAENIDFGFGLLGRVDKGGWFRVQRVQVSPTEWKTQRLEMHLSGRAVLFKSIARDTNETRGGFRAVPAGMSVAQGMRILEQSDAGAAPDSVARITPASFPAQR